MNALATMVICIFSVGVLAGLFWVGFALRAWRPISTGAEEGRRITVFRKDVKLAISGPTGQTAAEIEEWREALLRLVDAVGPHMTMNES